MLGGDQAALELWSQTRAWVISGQRKTLARLGISFDRVFFESDFLPEVVELTELGLQEGTLQRRPDGTVVYLTGREELEEMPLVRSDGIPTQHMRALAYWMAAPGLDDVTSIQICGQEWVAHVTCRRQLMAELVHSGPDGNGFHPLHDVFHGMVAKEQQAVASSKQDALLIDHLVEWLDEQLDGDRERAAIRDAHPAPERIASQVALGYFPLHPANKKVDFEPEKLLRRRQEPRLGHGARPRAQQPRGRLAERRPGRGPRLPLRGPPGGDVQAQPQPRLRAARPDAARPARLAPLALAPGAPARRPRRPGGRRGARRQRPRPRTGGIAMRTLLVDNHDSYTYNVFHLLAGVSGEEPIVVDNDAVSWRALERWDFDAIVLSPGPGTPQRWHDFCVCDDILRFSEIPVLGICLGHQGLGHLLDGKVCSAPEAMHGRLSRIHHEQRGLFEGIPQDFPVVRYHSLQITDMGPDGQITARADDGVVMGIEHLRRPLWGVQFHPESIATEHGARLIENFYALARRRKTPRRRGAKRPPQAPQRRSQVRRAPATGMQMRSRSLPGEPSTEALFERLFAGAEHAFWLDSADAPTRLAQRSYLGTSAGAERCVLEYGVETGLAQAHRAGGTETERGSIFDLLEREVAAHAIEPPAGLPPGLIGGFVGYLGYELKADCGAQNVHRSDLPDAVMMLANRLVVVDHVRHRTHLVTLCRDDEADAERWLDDAEAAVGEVLARPGPRRRPRPRPADPRRPRHFPGRPRPRAVPGRHRPLPGRNGGRRVL